MSIVDKLSKDYGIDKADLKVFKTKKAAIAALGYNSDLQLNNKLNIKHIIVAENRGFIVESDTNNLWSSTYHYVYSLMPRGEYQWYTHTPNITNAYSILSRCKKRTTAEMARAKKAIVARKKKAWKSEKSIYHNIPVQNYITGIRLHIGHVDRTKDLADPETKDVECRVRLTVRTKTYNKHGTYRIDFDNQKLIHLHGGKFDFDKIGNYDTIFDEIAKAMEKKE